MAEQGNNAIELFLVVGACLLVVVGVVEFFLQLDANPIGSALGAALAVAAAVMAVVHARRLRRGGNRV